MPAVSPSHARQRALLAVGLISAAALCWGALAPWGDAQARGQLTLESRVDASLELVRIAWRKLMEPPEPPVEALGSPLWWSAGDLDPREPQAVLERFGTQREVQAFDVLLARAEGLAKDDLPFARTELTAALGKYPEAAGRPEGLLRAIQFAVRAGDAAAVSEILADMQGLGLQQARKGTSYLLLAALAAAPLLDEAEGRVLGRGLQDAWADGTLALPPTEDSWRLVLQPAPHWLLEPDPWLSELGRRLATLGHSLGGPFDTKRAAASLHTLMNEVGPLPEAEAEALWELRPLGEASLLTRRDGLARRAVFVSTSSLAMALDDSVDLAEGFFLRGASEQVPAEQGVPVSDPLDLAQGQLPLLLFHADPSSMVREEQRRITALRVAFGALALLTALATALNLKALTREQRLADLKSQFIAGASHDLRTPLASILLMAENLEEGRIKEPDGLQRYYGAIRREAGRLRRLVDDVLDFSRIERGEGTHITREEVELAPFLDELDSQMRERVEQAGGQLETRRDSLPASAEFDPEALRRCAWNLLNNSLTHSGSDEVSFTVQFEAPRTLVIAVSDRGRGVPESDREAIFDPFFRGPDTSDASGGTGLGLAIVREVARAHGGDATVRPGPNGVGAVFQMHLDVAPVGA